jgi:hypothetical protein
MGLRTELVLRLPNSPGAAGAVCTLLAAERVNIAAQCLAPSGDLHLVVDNPVRAAGVLAQQRYAVATREVLYVPMPNAPGSLERILTLVADAGINLNYMYGSAGERAESTVVVLGVDDAPRAAAATGL